MAFDQIGLEAVLDGVSDFMRGGDEVNSSVAEMSSGMDIGAGIMSAAGDVITGALMRVGEIAVEALASAGGALVSFFSDSFSGALDAETTLARLTAQIEAQGPAAAVTASQAQDLADEYKNLAGGSDDAVIAAEAVLLKFRAIGSDVFPDAIASSADLAALMGTDVATAAQTLGLALDDPAGSLTRLDKATGAFTQEEKDQIKAMAESGDVAGAQALILSNLQDAIGGTAQTLADTTAGQWTIFKETIADAGENIMGAFLPALNGIMTGLAPVIPLIEDFANSISNVITLIMTGDFTGGIFGLMEDDPIIDFLFQVREALIGIQDFVVSNLPLVQETFATVWGSVQGVLQVLSDFITITLLPAIASIWEQSGAQLPTLQQTFEGVMAGIVAATQIVADFITNVLVPTLTVAVDWVVANWPIIQANIEAGWAAVQPILQATIDFFVTTLIPAFESVVAWVITNWPTIQANVESVMTAIQNVINAVLSVVVPFVVSEFEQIKGWVDTNWPLIQATIETVINAISAVITTVISAITAFWTANHETIETVAMSIWTNISTLIDTYIKIIEGVITTVMQIITGDWEGAWTTIQTLVTTVWTAMQTIVSSTLTAINAVITSIMSALSTYWSTIWTSILNATTGFLSSMLVSISGTIGNIVTAFTSIDWGAIGTGIIQGVQTGISNAVQGLVNAAVQAAVDAYNAARAALGISSPSTLFAGIGEDTMKGMALGIEDATPLPVDKADKSAKRMIGQMIDTLEASHPMLTNTARGMLNVINDGLSLGLNLDPLCQKLGKEAEKIGKDCISDNLNKGLGISADPLIDDLKEASDKICEAVGGIIGDPFSGGISLGGGPTRGGGMITPGIGPVSTGGVPVNNDFTRTGNTYQYAPTYGNAPVSPERDFAMMQVMAGVA